MVEYYNCIISNDEGVTMKKLKRIFLLAVLIIAALALTACGKTEPVNEVSLGDGLPAFEFSVPMNKADISEENLEAAYVTDNTTAPDVYVYSYEKADGQTLEDFGGEFAAQYKVFCNMISYEDIPCANITYELTDGKDFIVRSYVFESDDAFKQICFRYKTEKTVLGESGKTISLMDGWEEKTADGAFPAETDYEYADEYLPLIRIREFDKDYFTAETYDEALMPNTTEEEYSEWAEDGWTLEEAIAFYDDNYELLKGELIWRNGLDVAFIGYIDEGIFYVRAVIDCGDDYVMLCAENDAALFQHVVNALIDTIA